MKRKTLIVLILAALTGGWLAAQSKDDQKKTVVYDVKWRESYTMEAIVRQFTTGRVSNTAFNTLTVTATEREHVVVEELLKKYDVPAKNFQLQCYLLKASISGEGIKDGVPDFVRDVVQDVASLTRFTHFELIDAPILRVSDGSAASITGETPISYSISIGRNHVVEADGSHHLRIARFEIRFRILTGYKIGDRVLDPGTVEKELERSDAKPLVEPIYRSGGIETSFNIADGETIVLGASRMASVSSSKDPAEFAIVTVVTANLLP